MANKERDLLGAGLKKPYSECALMQLVPAEFRDKQTACRYIPLNEQHQTV